MKNVVITGVSTGIGYAAARELAAHGYHIFGSVRRPEDGARLQAELNQSFTPLLFDVTDEAAIQVAAEQVAEKINGRGLTGLINNAGIAVGGPLLHLPLAEFRRQLEVNLIGTLATSQAFLPLLGAKDNADDASVNAGHPPGRIINISSVSGRITYPFMVPYAVSKHGLESLSDGLRRELLMYGIDVIVIAPGSVRTPIWDKAAEADSSPYDTTAYASILANLQKVMVERGRAGIPVEQVSRTIRQALESERPQTRYILARNRFSGWWLPRWLPDRWFDRLLAKRLGLVKEERG